MLPIDRRQLLIGLGVLAGSGSAGTLGGCGRRSIEALGRLTAPVADSVEAESLGVEYLSRYPVEAEISKLRALLLASLPGPSVVDDVIDALHRRMVADFDRANTVRLGGWLFSRTELRLYALDTLRRQGGRTPHRTGVFPVEREGQERFRWTGALATRALTPRARFVRLRLRALAPVDQTVAVSIDGSTVGQVLLVRGEWQTLRYQGPGRNGRLELLVAPTWRPHNDFRTLGVQWNERASVRRLPAEPREDRGQRPAGTTDGTAGA